MRNITIILACALCSAFAQVQILVNVVGYEKTGTKRAVIQSTSAISDASCELVQGSSTVSSISLKPQTTVSGWSGRYFKVADFSEFTQNGKYRLKCGTAQSEEFSIGEKILQTETGSLQVSFFKGMRNTSEGDKSIKLYSSQTTHNIYGGWNDATGDRGKHLSHLSYANYFNPQQIPLVAWALLNASELQPSAFGNAATKEEAAWGADYLLRSLSAQDYFYMSVFDNWNDPEYPREICAWSGSTGVRSANYQSAMREGAGMSIAALARASKMGISGDSTSLQYLAGAKRAYAHLKANPTAYQDNKKENIIDDYCGLLAASELYNATNDPLYLTDAQARVQSLLSRQHGDGWFYTEDAAGNRPFYHAADEGLPIVALARYVEVAEPSNKSAIRNAIKKNLLWYVNISKDQNPFDYAKMYTIAGTPANPGVTDLARGKTATASRSEANYAASLAFDGNSTTRWSSYQDGAENNNQWIYVDLGEVYKVNKVVLNWETAYGKSYRIEVSTNSTAWSTALEITNNSAGKKEHSFAAPADARYVRMFGVERGLEYGGFSLYDFEVYGEKSDNAPPSPYQTRFFMPHDNETGYWWQGENARIASLSAAFTLGAQLADPSGNFWYDTLFTLAITQLDWILGKNPFGISMMFFKRTDYPDYPAKNPISNIIGGICNGITAKHGNESDLAWNNVEGLEEWDNWRYIEQWLPHNAWYLSAIAALSHRIENPIVPGEDPEPVEEPEPGEEPPASIAGLPFAVKNGAQVNVYNLRGQKLLSYSVAAGSAVKMPQGMAKGVYLLNIRDASGKNTTLRVCAP